MNKTLVSDHFEVPSEFDQLLEKAEEKATRDNEVKFVDDISYQFGKYGMQCSLTIIQLNWLRKIAGVQDEEG